ncbi:MAG: hypothetical protein KDD50_00620 [Bdellovibrionales bacterium]|nr:hypothetical protein [Bdellovibrionales bacterium]MCB0412804.1 hypothetical protein [Bdellovibrionales bacterium]
MSKRWNPKKIHLKTHKITKKQKEILLAELSQFIYEYICQLYKNDFKNSTVPSQNRMVKNE